MSVLKNIADSEQSSQTPSYSHQMHAEQILKMRISLYIALEWKMEDSGSHRSWEICDDFFIGEKEKWRESKKGK